MKKKETKPLVVISGVNLVEAGPLSVFKDAVNTFITHFIDRYDLVLLVNNKILFKELANEKHVELIAYAYPKKSWLLRTWFEYVHCYFISKKLNAYLWFAMHDMSPNVAAKKQVVYCHNPASFYNFTFHDFMLEKSLFFFKYFYNFFYKLNIHSNNYVIVQQDWMRKLFKEKFDVKNVIVAYPDVRPMNIANADIESNTARSTFIYPAMPRVFKNYEVLLSAAEKLSKTGLDFEVIVTINGTENKYSSYLKKRFSHVANIKFIGLQPREALFKLYAGSDCLVFPSKLETWGLPITEMKYFHKPILVADAAYAPETIGDYDKVCFFKESDADELAGLMKGIIEKNIQFKAVVKKQIEEPFSNNWKGLLTILLK